MKILNIDSLTEDYDEADGNNDDSGICVSFFGSNVPDDEGYDRQKLLSYFNGKGIRIPYE